MLVAIAVALGLTVFLASYAIYQLILQQGRLLLRLESLEQNLRQQGILPGTESGARGLKPGTVLNDFELPTLAGGTTRLSEWRGRKVLLIFFDPACEYCRAMLPDLAALEPGSGTNGPWPLILSTGSADQNRRLFEEHGVRCPVLMQEQREVAELYLAFASPAGYLVDEKGSTISGLLLGADTLLAAARQTPLPAETRAQGVISRVANSRLARDGLKAGTPAPAFSLPRLDGAELSLEAFRGHPVLLVFSDPACGPCNQLAPRLEQIHRRARDLRVLMISRGEIEANRNKIAEYEISFPVVLQRHWEVSRAYGMFATPIAYLIDEEGVLASDVLVGADAILKAASRGEGRTRRRRKELAPA